MHTDDPDRLVIFDARPLIDDESVRRLVRALQPLAPADVAHHLLDRYRHDDAALVGAADAEGRTVGLAGLRLEENAMGTIIHLGVIPEARRRGVGRGLVLHAIERYALASLMARTPEEFLPFFTALGFTHWLIGEQPPGRRWYGVRWRAGS